MHVIACELGDVCEYTPLKLPPPLPTLHLYSTLVEVEVLMMRAIIIQILTVKDSAMGHVESPRCCESVAIRKKRHGNIGLNGHLHP